MAQKIYMNYKQALTSNDFNRWFLGLLEPGRYRGFDTLTPSGLSFTINHTTTGILITEENLSQSPATGILLTHQGFIIQEDSAIAGVCGTNGSNPHTRIDWLICTHEDVNTIGGQAAVYSVLQGALSVEPTLPNPEKQILVGKISIPGLATNLNSATYTPVAAPSLGGQNIFTNYPELDAKYAKLTTPNAFTTQNQGHLITSDITITSGKWTPATTGNTFNGGGAGALVINEIENIRAGLVVRLRARANTITINLNGTPTAGGITVRAPGLEAMGLTTLVLNDGDAITLQNWNFSTWRIIGYSDRLARQLKITNDTVAQHTSDIATAQSNISALQAITPLTVITGEIKALAGSTVPAGFLECNGAAVSRTTYATLFALVGVTYGAGDSVNTFNIPDLRGEFLRGWDNSRGIDVARSLGSAQGDLVKSHTHPVTSKASTSSDGTAGTLRDYNRQASLPNTAGQYDANYNTDASGGVENRPRNIAVMYIIKY